MTSKQKVDLAKLEVTQNYSDHQLREFKTCVVREWSKVDFGDGDKDIALPAPALAFFKGNLVGGLSFIYYAKPQGDGIGLWVNTLFVKPEYRGKGIGTAIITHSLKYVTDENTLYVFTDIPELYEKAGWKVISNRGSNRVLVYEF